MSAIEVSSLFGTLDLRDNATGALRAFRGEMDSTEAFMNRIGGAMQGLGLAITAVTGPLVAFGAAGVQTAASFEDSMAEISARAGIVGEDLQRVSDFALQMGADTSFSAQQAANAFLQLLTSGQDVTQAFSTLPAVLTAAAASGEALGTTADMVTDILAAFGLGVEDAESVVDDLARAAGASSASMASLGQGIGNVGPIAAQFGISFKETAAILAVFEENGIKGAEAGTQLRSMLTGMTRGTEESIAAWARLGTSMYDAMGNVRPIGDVLQDIARGLAGMTDQQRIETLKDLAGAYGQIGLAALTSGDPLRNMLGLMDGSASAAEVAAARMDTFNGRMEQLRGSLETLQIRAFTPFLESLKPMIERATAIINRMSEWASANPQLTVHIIQLTSGVAALGGALLTVGTAMKLVAPAVALISSAFLPVALLTAAIVGLRVAYQSNFLGIADIIDAGVTRIKRSLFDFMWFLTGLNARGDLVRRVFDTLGLGVKAITSGFDAPEMGRLLTALINLGAPVERLAGYFFKVMVAAQDVREVLRSLGEIQLPDWMGNISAPDFGAIAGTIRGELANLDFSDVQGIFERHFDGILKLIGSAATIIFGGPVGAAIGIGGLLKSAIESDFLGIGTWLQESGIAGTFAPFFDDIRRRAEEGFSLLVFYAEYYLGQLWDKVRPGLEAISGWFTGTGTDSASGTLQGAATWLQTHIQPIIGDFIGLLSSIWTEVEPALGPLGRWFTEDVLPLMKQTIETIFLPAVKSLINTLRVIWNVVGPPLGDLLEWFTTTGLPAVTDFLSITVVPLIGDFINLLSTLWTTVEPHLIAFRDGVMGIFDWIKTNVLDPIVSAIEAVQNALNGLHAPGQVGPVSGIGDDFFGRIGTGDKGGGSQGKIGDGSNKFPPLSDAWGNIFGGGGGTSQRMDAGPYMIEAPSRSSGSYGGGDSWMAGDHRSTSSKHVNIHPGAVVVHVHDGDPEKVRMAVWAALEDLGNEA